MSKQSTDNKQHKLRIAIILLTAEQRHQQNIRLHNFNNASESVPDTPTSHRNNFLKAAITYY